MIDGLSVTPLDIIDVTGGNVLHIIKASDKSYSGFGEAYFSSVSKDTIKGWKKHTQMTLNIVVPIGKIKFVVYDEYKEEFFSVVLSQENYQRLTIKSGQWLAFRGVETNNLLLNIASIEHDTDEVKSLGLNKIIYEW